MHILLAVLLLSEIAAYRDAAALVDRAIAKRGEPLGTVAFQLDAVVRQLHQSPRPAEPYLETQLTQTIAADLGARSFFMEETTIWPYFTSRTTQRLEGGELTTIRHATGTHTTSRDGIDAAVARIARRHPDLLLDAARRRRASLRSAAPDKVRFVLDDGGVMTATFREARLVSVDWIAYDAVFGDVSHRIEYEWSPDNPTGFRQFDNGRLFITGRYGKTSRGEAVPHVSVPADSRLSPPSPTATPRIEELAPDVFLLRNAGGADYHSLLVRFVDRLVVVEAPRSPQLARAAMAAIRAWDPARPIERVVITHHHDDHIGGVRAYAEAGSEVVTTAGNVATIRALLAAPHTIQSAPSISTAVVKVAGERIHDHTNELVLLNPGPNDHVAESLVAWLPRQQILFQGDLFRHDPGRPEAARNAAVALADFIAKKDLPVKTIAGVHGEPASMADLRDAIQRRR